MEAILMSYSDAGFTCESAKLHPEKRKFRKRTSQSERARLFVRSATRAREREVSKGALEKSAKRPLQRLLFKEHNL